MTQIDFFEEIAVDNFAGGGGASTGIELASGRPVAIAINHDPDAILLHASNHRYTKHLQESVWDVDPIKECAGRPVGLAWFSPDCKHFSKARGGKPVDKQIRGLSWVIFRWALDVRPRVIMMENVEEIQTWGPLIQVVKNGKKQTIPDPKRVGETFQAFIGMLTTGIPKDHPALTEACKFLKIRKNGQAAKQLIAGLGYKVEYKELVAADYGAPTTRKRFVLVARCDGKPIVWPERTHAPRDSKEVRSGKCLPWRSAAEIIDWNKPGYSIFASRKEIKEEFGVKAQRPLQPNTLRRVIRGVDKFSIRSGSPFLVECNHSGDGHIRSIGEPVNTLTAKYTGGVCQPVMAPFTFGNTSGSIGSPVSEPVHTITSAGNQVIAGPVMVPFTFSNTGGSVGADAASPIHTVRTGGGGQVLAAANLIQYHAEKACEYARASGVNTPLYTVDASNRYGLACANLVEYYGNGVPLDVRKPLHTVTSRDREALSMAHIVKYKGTNLGHRMDAPLQTVTSQGLEYADCRAVLAKADGRDLGNWPKIRALLNEHCGYSMADDEVILLIIFGIPYFIADITLRMLTPRELYNAMGFPVDYIIDRDCQGNEYAKGKQVARCGNAVCPPLAEAMVRANLPEWCGAKYTTMAQWHNAVAG